MLQNSKDKKRYIVKNKSSLSLTPSHSLSLLCMVDCYCHQRSLLFAREGVREIKIYFKELAYENNGGCKFKV